MQRLEKGNHGSPVHLLQTPWDPWISERIAALSALFFCNPWPSHSEFPGTILLSMPFSTSTC